MCTQHHVHENLKDKIKIRVLFVPLKILQVIKQGGFGLFVGVSIYLLNIHLSVISSHNHAMNISLSGLLVSHTIML